MPQDLGNNARYENGRALDRLGRRHSALCERTRGRRNDRSMNDPSAEKTTMVTNEFSLPPARLEAFGAEIQALHQKVRADLGERDATYIRAVVRLQRRAELTGR